MEPTNLRQLYGNRFGADSLQRDVLWDVLCRQFFQKYVPLDASVLDLAAGHCEFINHIACSTKIAVDLNPDVATRAAPDVKTHVASSDDLSFLSDGSVDVVWVSNFFEHITRDQILSTLREVRRVLASDGHLLILQPNIRFCARDYWMFFDHITPLDDRSMTEALAMTGFAVTKCIERFLPYTTKSRLPTTATLVRLYLRTKLAWRVLGAQSFLVAEPTT
jgi:ubiquinone/menaquinone biosynthesis C-methylase UbiE